MDESFNQILKSRNWSASSANQTQFHVRNLYKTRKSTNFGLLKSTQYKKLAPNALQFTYHMKKQNKKHHNAKLLVQK